MRDKEIILLYLKLYEIFKRKSMRMHYKIYGNYIDEYCGYPTFYFKKL
jgi:hypothetical protein